MISENKEGLDFLQKLRRGEIKKGLGIDCELDKNLRFKRGSFNVFAGHANVGKTKFILYYYLCLAVKHGLKFLIFSSENTVHGIKRDLIQLHARKELKDLKDFDFQYHFEFINEHFKFIDYQKFYNEKKRFMNFRDVLKVSLEDCEYFDALVIDPYNSLAPCEDLKGNAHERDYQVASELRMFAKKNNKTIYVLAHGNTEALRKTFPKDHEYYKHTMPLMAADIEGGGKWVNRADDFVVIHRLTQHPAEWKNTEIHVRKVKETETGGKPTMLDNPVIFQLQPDQLSFEVYERLEFNFNPIDKTDPLQEIENGLKQPKNETTQTAIQPNLDFDTTLSDSKGVNTPQQYEDTKEQKKEPQKALKQVKPKQYNNRDNSEDFLTFSEDWD